MAEWAFAFFALLTPPVLNAGNTLQYSILFFIRFHLLICDKCDMSGGGFFENPGQGQGFNGQNQGFNQGSFGGQGFGQNQGSNQGSFGGGGMGGRGGTGGGSLREELFAPSPATSNLRPRKSDEWFGGNAAGSGVANVPSGPTGSAPMNIGVGFDQKQRQPRFSQSSTGIGSLGFEDEPPLLE